MTPLGKKKTSIKVLDFSFWEEVLSGHALSIIISKKFTNLTNDNQHKIYIGHNIQFSGT
jgi:hypothetical protein